jgi:hypothetical protein
MPDCAIESGTVLVPRPGLRTLVLPDGGVTLYAEESDQAAGAPAAFVMNDSAAAVWSRLDGRRTVGSVVADLERLHAGVDLADDVVRVLAAMDRAGLLERA